MRRRVVASCCLAATAFAVGGWWFGLAAAAMSPMVATVHRRQRERAGRHRRERALPEALEIIVLAAQAGLTPHQIIRLLHDVGPVELRPATAAVLRRMELGESLTDAVGELPIRLGPASVAAADALRLAQLQGTPIAETATVLATEAHRQRRHATEIAARRLPVQLSFPLVCCILPAFVLLAVVPAVLGALGSIRSTGW